MRTFTEHTYLKPTTVTALTHIKCDKCGKEIGSFDMDNKGFYAGVKYKHTDWPKKRVWYKCKRIQNTPYDLEKGYNEKEPRRALFLLFAKTCSWRNNRRENKS